MNAEEYLKNRVEPCLEWYSYKARSNKKYYTVLKIMAISAAAMLPFISGMISDFSNLRYIVGGLGVLIAITEGVLILNKFQEKWTLYRTLREAIKQEQYLFLTQSGPYKNTDAFALLVERVEGLISKENSNWKQIVVREDKGAEEKKPQIP